MRWLLVGVAAMGLVGCSSAPPAEWMLYSRVNYLYGRLEAATENACLDTSASLPLQRLCATAKTAREEIKTIKPVVERELAQSKPDWNRIFQYIDLVLGYAVKFVIP